MKLYGSPASPYVVRVAMAAKAKGVDLPLTEAPGGGIKSPEYLAINPLGKMPAFTDDKGRHLAESQVICEYLDETLQGPALLPADPYDRARVRLLCRIVDLYLGTSLGTFFRNMNPTQRNQAEVDAAHTAFNTTLGQIEGYMGAGPYMYGNTLTLADCMLYPSFITTSLVLPAFGVTNQFEKFPKLARWWQAMAGDAVTGALGKQQHEAMLAFMKSRAG